MPVKNNKFQPGTVLHEVIVGAFRSAGSSFEAWCKEHEVHTSSARQATYGQSGGDKGKALLDQIIDAAGRDLVAAAYAKRVIMEAERLKSPAQREARGVAA